MQLITSMFSYGPQFASSLFEVHAVVIPFFFIFLFFFFIFIIRVRIFPPLAPPPMVSHFSGWVLRRVFFLTDVMSYTMLAYGFFFVKIICILPHPFQLAYSSSVINANAH